MDRVYALMHQGSIYTLRPYRGPHKGWSYIGFCDGNRCGFFRTKKDFEDFVSREPALAPLGPHAKDAFAAQSMSEFEGRVALQRLHENKGKPCPTTPLT